MSCTFQQCLGKTKLCRPCRRKTCFYAPFCHQHSAVRVERSPIQGMGNGVVAKRDIKSGEVLGNYKIGTKSLDVSNLPQDREYVWMPSQKEAYDGNYKKIKSVNSIAPYFNRGGKAPDGKTYSASGKIYGSGQVRATVNIKKGKEILVTGYGPAYKMH